jgi:hypothetical protein
LYIFRGVGICSLRRDIASKSLSLAREGIFLVFSKGDRQIYPEKGTNTVLVAHGNLMRAATGEYTDEGGLLSSLQKEMGPLKWWPEFLPEIGCGSRKDSNNGWQRVL